jgi:hypothetical protein
MSELLYDYMRDKVSMKSFSSDQWLYDDKKPFDEAVVIKADNVYRYTSKLPSITLPPKPMPPFKYSFVEVNLGVIGNIGIHVACLKHNDTVFTNGLSFLNDIEDIKSAKATLIFHYLKLVDGIIYLLDLKTISLLDDNFNLSNSYSIGDEASVPGAVPFCYLALFTFSLMNCKNAIIINNNPQNKLQKKRHRRGEFPLVQYKTISVNGSLLTINNQHLISQNDNQLMPFHIVRGNFAVYDDKPLFGKHYGTYWRPQHSRGDKKLGIIEKDYSVQEPKI